MNHEQRILFAYALPPPSLAGKLFSRPQAEVGPVELTHIFGSKPLALATAAGTIAPKSRKFLGHLLVRCTRPLGTGNRVVMACSITLTANGSPPIRSIADRIFNTFSR
jgi:hypothetical protein